MPVKDQVIAIVAEQALLAPGDIKMTDTPADLGLDSLGLVEIVFAVEETFDVTVPFNANEPNAGDFDISTVASIVAGVERMVTEQKA